MPRIILTGASGWFGQSFIGNYALTYGEDRARADLVLVTSDGREIFNPRVNGPLATSTFGHVIDSKPDVSAIVQAAFLTRDKLEGLGERRFRDVNLQIIRSLARLLSMYPSARIYVISSGAVKKDRSAYGLLKSEEESVVLAERRRSFVFRVYGAHGRFCEYRNWSAFCDLGRQALRSREIFIRSRVKTVRGFVSFDQLATLILRLNDLPEYIAPSVIDTVSEVVDLRALGAMFAEHYAVNLITTPLDIDAPPNIYSGQCAYFLEICKRLGVADISVDKMVRDLRNNEFVSTYQ